MKKKIIIFKNDRVGDLVPSVPAIKKIITQNSHKEIILYLSEMNKNFYFLIKNTNTRLKVVNFDLNIFEKIKIFFYLIKNKIDQVYILSPKNFYFFLPLFFLKTKFFGLCINGVNGYRRPNFFFRKLLFKYVINDRETKKKRKIINQLYFDLVNVNNDIKFNVDLDIVKSEKLKKYLPNNYVILHYKKKLFDIFNWGVNGLESIIDELKNHYTNIVLIKDLKKDETNLIFRNKYKTFDFETNIYHNNNKNNNVIFFDNIESEDLYNAIKFSKKVVSFHGTITMIASLNKIPTLDLFYSEIIDDKKGPSLKNILYEFKPRYKGYDFIIPSKSIEKTLKKMRFTFQN